MPRYEFSDGSSNKFWEITLEGTSFTTTYGRLGTEGQSSLKEYDSDDKAKKEHDKLVAEKVKKGYALVGGGGAAPAAEAPKAAAKPAEAKPAAKKAVFDDEGDDDEAPAKPAKKAAAPAKASPVPAAAVKTEGARLFEFVDGTSKKFWEIALEGSSFTTRYGKIGTDGQSSLKEYDSDEKALAEYQKLVTEKTKKGYVEK